MRPGLHAVFPGTVYNFGPTPCPCSRKRRSEPVRAKAHPSRDGAAIVRANKNGARVLIVRAGDLLRAQGGEELVRAGTRQTGKPVARVSNPGRGVGHQWSSSGRGAHDAGIARGREALGTVLHVHMAGHWMRTDRRWLSRIRRVVQRRTGRAPRITGSRGGLLPLVSPLTRRFRELREMRYLWRDRCRWITLRLTAGIGARAPRWTKAVERRCRPGLPATPIGASGAVDVIAMRPAQPVLNS